MMLTRTAAQRFPDEVAGLVLIDPSVEGIPLPVDGRRIIPEDIAMSIKWATGAGITAYPIFVIIPMSWWRYRDHHWDTSSQPSIE